jgi:hypothetical protein
MIINNGAITMTGTTNVYNRGIAHLGRGGAGKAPVCNNRRAHITVTREQFKSGAWGVGCAKCAALLAKWEAKEAGR